ncbi:hypothetical protein F4779DRAFT_606637 [Xylariaceae sp. FL0662B]|nr:hypothetical protein F4779DRAFT_606637 [Xylariaceae sp. FL0662B]
MPITNAMFFCVRCLYGAWRFFPDLVGPHKHHFPSTRTLLVSLCSYVFSLFFGIIASTKKATPIIILFVWVLLAILVVVFCFLDWLNYRKRSADKAGDPLRLVVYSRNISNTVIIAITTLISIPLLYGFVWYPALNKDVITLEKDTVDRVYFPSLTLFQRVDWTSQGTLDVNRARPKCFIGWLDENATHCGLNNSELPCSCHDRWSGTVEDFFWKGTLYRALSLIASEDMVCTVPNTLMLAQAFLWYDSSKASDDSSRRLSPSLWVAIHDPTLTVKEALENDSTRPMIINANGMIAINLGLNYRQIRGKSPAYDYDISISSIPTMDMTCDNGSDTKPSYQPCFVSLWLQFPTFERQVSTQGFSMGWVDVVASAGSWFSLFQIISWIVSGLAMQT